MPPLLRPDRVFAAFAVALAGVVIASTVWGIAAHRPALPFLDHWAIYADAEALDRGTLDAALLLRPHNEHWIVVPRLLLLLDALVTHGQGWLAVAMTWVCQGLHGLLLWWLARGPRVGAAIRAAVALLLFAAVQIENLAEPFQVQFVLVYLAATAAFAAVGRAAQTPGQGRWSAAAIAAAVIATGSMGNGVLVWPLLAGLAWWLGLRRRVLAAIAIVGLLLIAAEVLLYHAPAGHPSPLASLGRPVELLGYWLAAVGSAVPWPGATGGFALAAGAAVVALWVFAALVRPVACDRGGEASARRAPIVAAALFVLASLGLIAVGRLPFGLDSALAGRYCTPAVLFTALVLLLGRMEARPRVRGLATAIAAALVLLVVVQQSRRIDGNTVFAQRRDPAALACLCSIRDAEWLTAGVGPIEGVPLDQVVPFLRQRRWSAFASGRHLALGLPLALVIAGPITACAGSIDAVTAIPDTGWGVRVRGHAQLPARAVPRRGVVVDGDHRVVGLCDVMPARDASGAVEFTGLASARGNGDTVRVILGDGAGDGAGWEVAGGGQVEGLAVGVAGAPFDSVPQALGAAFAPPGAEAVALASAAAWRGVAASTVPGMGLATLGPFAASRAFVLPVATGAETFGVGAAVLDQPSGRVLALLRPAPTFGAWRLWRVEVPADCVGHPLTIQIGDFGDRDGQWLAFAAPLTAPN